MDEASRIFSSPTDNLWHNSVSPTSVYYIPIPLLANTRGTAEITLTFPTFIPSLITYWQAITFDPANIRFPLETTDVITVFVF